MYKRQGKAETVVTEKNTAKAMGSGTLDVFATPAMVALMEEAAWKCVAPELEPGMGTVGTPVSYTHLDVYKRQISHASKFRRRLTSSP